MKEFIQRLDIKSIVLTSESDWQQVILNDKDMEHAKNVAIFQQEESLRMNLKSTSIDSDYEKSLVRNIAAKQFEYALRQYGGGTARVTNPNEFHDYPDVGQVNARFVFDKDDGLMIMKRDQLKVPMILGTGEPPHFYLMGWVIPAYAKYMIYRINMGREEATAGFLRNMQDHEACTVSRQWLLPMWSFNKELIK